MLISTNSAKCCHRRCIIKKVWSVVLRQSKISASFGVFWLLLNHQDLSTASLLGQGTQQLPINSKKLGRCILWKKMRPSDNTWDEWLLKVEAKARQRMELSSAKPKTEDSSPFADVTKTKTEANFFLWPNQDRHHQWESGPKLHPLVFLLVERNTPDGPFRKTSSTQGTKLVADSKLCFSWLNSEHSIRKCQKPRNFSMQGWLSTQNTSLYSSEGSFYKNAVEKLTKMTKVRETKKLLLQTKQRRASACLLWRTFKEYYRELMSNGNHHLENWERPFRL